MSKLRYQTLRENVTKVIREKILNRELQPGMRIIEQNLSEELEVSRGPIREALRQLEQGRRCGIHKKCRLLCERDYNKRFV